MRGMPASAGWAGVELQIGLLAEQACSGSGPDARPAPDDA